MQFDIWECFQGGHVELIFMCGFTIFVISLGFGLIYMLLKYVHAKQG
jgi:hypothetical protein